MSSVHVTLIQRTESCKFFLNVLTVWKSEMTPKRLRISSLRMQSLKCWTQIRCSFTLLIQVHAMRLTKSLIYKNNLVNSLRTIFQQLCSFTMIPHYVHDTQQGWQSGNADSQVMTTAMCACVCLLMCVWFVCRCACMWASLCMCVCLLCMVCVYVCSCVCACLCVYVCFCVCILECMHVRAWACVCLCMCVRVCVCVCVYI